MKHLKTKFLWIILTDVIFELLFRYAIQKKKSFFFFGSPIVPCVGIGKSVFINPLRVNGGCLLICVWVSTFYFGEINIQIKKWSYSVMFFRSGIPFSFICVVISATILVISATFLVISVKSSNFGVSMHRKTCNNFRLYVAAKWPVLTNLKSARCMC